MKVVGLLPATGFNRLWWTSCGKRYVLVQAERNEVFAQFVDGGEQDADDSEGARCVDVELFVVDEERFFGARAELFEG